MLNHEGPQATWGLHGINGIPIQNSFGAFLVYFVETPQNEGHWIYRCYAEKEVVVSNAPGRTLPKFNPKSD